MKSKLKALSLVLVLSLILTSSTVAYAADNKEVTSNGSSGAEVNLSVPSTFSVLIPKTITLEGNPGTATYTVGVKGDIDGNEQVQVIPASSMTLTNDVKPSITASVAQVRTAWAYDDLSTSTYDYTSGTITGGDASAGKYVGTLMFTINLVDENGVIVGGSENVGVIENNLAPGVYDRYDVLLSSWEDSGIDIEQEYTGSNNNTETTSGYYVFMNDSRFATAKKVVIPSSVTKVGKNAFYKCTSLLSVVIPDSVTTIGSSAFYGCTSLTSVAIPNSVTTIGGWVFYECTSLTSVTIGNSVAEIGEHAFDGCTSLTGVTIPNSVTTIGDSVFEDCSSLISVTISDSVTIIGARTFINCYSLTSITIPDSVKTLRVAYNGFSNYGAFEGCSNLASVSYAGVPYTSKSALVSAMTSEGVSVSTAVFAGTAMLD